MDEYLRLLAAGWDAGCCTPSQGSGLVSALLRRDQRLLDRALAIHTAAELAAVQQPLPLYHAAALADWPDAVAALAAAGVPPLAADALVHVPEGSLLACALAHASMDHSRTAGELYSAAARLGNWYSAVGMAAATGHVRVATALLAIGASATAGRELGALPALRAVALHERDTAMQGLLSGLAAAGGHMTPREVADAVQHAHFTGRAIQALLQQLTEQRASLHGLSETELNALASAAHRWGCTEMAELLPPTLAAEWLPLAASKEDPAFLIRLLRHLGRPLPCPASTQAEALKQAFFARRRRSLTALLAAGAQPDTEIISLAIYLCDVDELRSLLAVAQPPEPPLTGTIDLRSPHFAPELPSFVHQTLFLAGEARERGTLVRWLQMAEALVASGYSLRPYHDVTVRLPEDWGQHYSCFNPITDDPCLANSADALWVLRAVERATWSPSTHQQFPPAFRAACRTLLLAGHRSTTMHSGIAQKHDAAGLQRPAHLGSLPTDALLLIVQQAAFPLSLWFALPSTPPPAKEAALVRQLLKTHEYRTQPPLSAAPAVGSLLGAAPTSTDAPPAARAFANPAAALEADSGVHPAESAAAFGWAAKPVQLDSMAAGVADVVAAFQAATASGASASSSGMTAAAVGLAATDSTAVKAANFNPEQLSGELLAFSFSTHVGPFVFGASS